jgi:putative PIN family toxin of toxin-antitoxin system
MNSDHRFVFDTNVIVSALLFADSNAGHAFLHALDHGRVLVGQTLAEELQDVLSRPKFDKYVTRQQRETFLEAFIRESEVVQVTESIHVCRDPKDDHVLELAVSGKASLIVTGDEDLLVLNPFRNIPILSPANFLAMEIEE